MKYTEQERLVFARSRQSEKKYNEIDNTASIHFTAVIGKDGFGFVRNETGELEPMPHTGNVIIEKWVTIGAQTCVDRAVIGSTIISEGSKLDNLVHIGHGAKVGKHCLIVAGSVLGGSCEIGDYTFIGMNASIKNKIKVGKNCTIGAGAVVVKDVPDGETWVGNPARALNKEPRQLPEPGSIDMRIYRMTSRKKK
jgi:UDP-3-O-[3-hydroxymyristoyl] glucosamine N-acyltransferase